MAMINYSDDIVTVLTADVTETDLVANVASSAGFPILGVDDWFWVTIQRIADGERERIKVTEISGTVWTIERDTTPLAFSSGDSVTLSMSSSGRIGVLGASESVFPWFDTWSSLAQRAFNAEGIDVDVFHTGSGGITHYTAMNSIDPELGQSYVELTNSLDLDIIIVELGLNDAMLNSGGRTRAQIIADAQALYAALRTGSPDAVIVYSRQIPYDEDQHGTKDVTDIKKKYCVPYMQTTSTMPGESGLYTSEKAELEKVIEPTMQDRLADWRALDAECQGLADVVVHTNYFRPARLGLLSHDRLHGSSLGHLFTLSDIWKAFKSDATLSARLPQLTRIRHLGDFTDMSITWESAVKPDDLGDGYVIDPDWLDGFEYPMWLNIRDYAKVASYPEYWGNQQRPSISISDRVVRSNGEIFIVMIANVWPDQAVSTKIWPVGGSEPSQFIEYSPVKTTSGTGDMLEAYSPSSGDKPAGDYFIKYRIGNDVFGPFPVTLSGTYPWE